MNETGQPPDRSPRNSDRKQGRIPFSPSYLIAVVLMTVLNCLFFVVLASQVRAPGHPVRSSFSLALLFGILFAAACALTANSIVRWLARESSIERVLFFMLTELAGMTILAVVVPHVAGHFWGG